ncbi:unnamed protein product [Cuscuta epithymum]|uniref:Uncharacterized protein n=1 Tax=Cuscuta epithymum TaxID=186058 RepID=A0AAV0GF91_9ASTE|nr:unnamed protein product [Cuscuta epithymum]
MKNQLQDKARVSTSSDVQINMADTSSKGRSWIIDSGASEHIICNNDGLFNIQNRTSTPTVKIPNGLILEEADWGGQMS